MRSSVGHWQKRSASAVVCTRSSQCTGFGFTAAERATPDAPSTTSQAARRIISQALEGVCVTPLE